MRAVISIPLSFNSVLEHLPRIREQYFTIRTDQVRPSPIPPTLSIMIRRQLGKTRLYVPTYSA